MKHISRTILCIMTIFAMVFAMAPLEPAMADDGTSDDYTLIVGGVTVTDENKDDILGDGGKAKFDPASGTLTLDDPVLRDDLDNSIYSKNLDLTVKGNANLTGTSKGIFADDGSLTVESGNITINVKGYYDVCGMCADEDLWIEDGTVKITAESYGGVLCDASGLCSNWGIVDISGGTVTVDITNGYDSKGIEGETVIFGGDVTITSKGMYADGIADSSFTMMDGNVNIKCVAEDYCHGIQARGNDKILIAGGELDLECEGGGKGNDAIGSGRDILILGGKITAKVKGDVSNGISQFSYSDSQFIITGGDINVSASGDDASGIYTSQPLKISGGKVESNGTDIGIAGEDTIMIGNGIESVTASGGESGIYTTGSIYLDNELTIKQPANGKIKDDLTTIVDKNGNHSKNVLIVNENKYFITVNETEHGTAYSDRTKANGGDAVTITSDPEEGYHLISVKVTDAYGEEVDVTETESGYRFTMPESDVSVSPVFDHEWEEPAYEWAEDNSTVTARRICKDDESIVEEETVGTVSEVITAATCTEDGEAVFTSQAFENEAFTVQEKTAAIPASGHKWGSWTVTKKATVSAKGEKQRVCRNDSSHIEIKDVPKLISIKNAKVVLSAKAYTYNGKVRRPTVKKVAGKKLKQGTDFTVKWSNKSSKNVGTYTVTITGKGKYTGVTKASYKINPKGTSIKTLTKAQKAFTVKWTKQSKKMSKSRITGYQIQAATNSKFTKNKKTVTVKGYSKTSKKVTGLKGGSKYYVRVRTYKTVSGKKYYSPWSKTKTVTTKK